MFILMIQYLYNRFKKKDCLVTLEFPCECVKKYCLEAYPKGIHHAGGWPLTQEQIDKYNFVHQCELESVGIKSDPWGCFKMPVKHKTFVEDCTTCQELTKELKK